MILFVCTGNTCRSPLAAALAQKMGWAAESAGLAAAEGDPATDAACRAAIRHGLALEGHRARPVTRELIAGADRVYAMTAGHAAALRALFPGEGEKIRVLSPPIPDPYGGGDGAYERCVRVLTDALKKAGL